MTGERKVCAGTVEGDADDGGNSDDVAVSDEVEVDSLTEPESDVEAAASTDVDVEIVTEGDVLDDERCPDVPRADVTGDEAV